MAPKACMLTERLLEVGDMSKCTISSSNKRCFDSNSSLFLPASLVLIEDISVPKVKKKSCNQLIQIVIDLLTFRGIDNPEHDMRNYAEQAYH